MEGEAPGAALLLSPSVRGYSYCSMRGEQAFYLLPISNGAAPGGNEGKSRKVYWKIAALQANSWNNNKAGAGAQMFVNSHGFQQCADPKGEGKC